MYNFLLVLRALITNRVCHICNSEGRDLAGWRGEGGGGGGGGGGDRGQGTLPVGSGGAGNVPTVSWRSAWNGESWILRGVSARIYVSGKRKQELIRACSRLSDSGEWHFPLSKRLVQDRSWWANKMIEQKEIFYKDRTSVPEPIFCSLVSSKTQTLCSLKMRNKALLSAVRTLTFSCHVM